LLIRHSIYSAILSKTHSYRLSTLSTERLTNIASANVDQCSVGKLKTE